MINHFAPLPAAGLSLYARVRRAAHDPLILISAEHPATAVMTDFTHTTPITIGVDISIEDANRRMIEHGIRLLLVVDHADVLVGVITAVDDKTQRIGISLGLSDDIRIGQQLIVTSADNEVGHVEVLTVKRDSCVAGILDQQSDRPIQKGDRIKQ